MTYRPRTKAEERNHLLADQAKEALRTFVALQTGQETSAVHFPDLVQDEPLVDLLTGLRHWTGYVPLDYAKADRQARKRYQRELAEETATRLGPAADTSILAIGTRVAIGIDQGLQKAQGIVREVQTDDGDTTYRVDITSGDACNGHRNAAGELWVCPFEVKPLPA